MSFPDVGDLSDRTNGAFDDPTEDLDNLAAALALANQERKKTAVPTSHRPGDSTNTMGVSLGLVSQHSEQAPVEEVKADIAEPATDWTEKPATRETRTEPKTPQEQAKSDSKSSEPIDDKTFTLERMENGSDLESSKPIGSLTQAIIERFPLGDPSVLTFVGSETNLHIDETSAKIASELAGRKIGRILLVDADTETKTLTRASGVESEPGLSDVINKSIAWDSAIYGRSATGLDFMGAGTDSLRHEESESRLRQLVAELKQHYQFICVAAGDAHSNSAKLWNDVSDGSYLLVSIKNSNETYAKSAVAEMRSCGARLLGCVVTDVD